MKHIPIIFLAVALLVGGCTQNKRTGFSIKGTFNTDTQTDSVFLYSKEGEVMASAPVVNGKFELKGSVSEPRRAILLIPDNSEDAAPDDKESAGSIILDNADYSYTKNGIRPVIKGGKLHDVALGFESTEEYHKAAYELDDIVHVVLDNASGEELTPEELNRINEKEKALAAVTERFLAAVIEDPQSPVLAKAFAVGRMDEKGEKYPLEKRIELLNTYAADPQVSGNKDINSIRETLDTEKKAREAELTVSEGNQFKDIEGKDVNGNTIKLSEIVTKNKYTILEFWASWCAPCRGEIPNLKKAYEKYKPKGLEIYSISLDMKHDDWLKALKEENTSWTNVVDKLGGIRGEAIKYGVLGIPTSFLIDKEGKIVETSDRLTDKQLDQTLGKHMP